MMADDPADGRSRQEEARRQRLARALRDNLKRRKSQSRGRADAPAEAAEAAEAGTVPADRPGRDAADETS